MKKDKSLIILISIIVGGTALVSILGLWIFNQSRKNKAEEAITQRSQSMMEALFENDQKEVSDLFMVENVDDLGEKAELKDFCDMFSEKERKEFTVTITQMEKDKNPYTGKKTCWSYYVQIRFVGDLDGVTIHGFYDPKDPESLGVDKIWYKGYSLGKEWYASQEVPAEESEEEEEED